MTKKTTTPTAGEQYAVQLTADELAFIAASLEAYAGECLEHAGLDTKLAEVEIQGRKLCTKIMRAFAEGSGHTVLELEQTYIKARDSFCGIAPDEYL